MPRIPILHLSVLLVVISAASLASAQVEDPIFKLQQNESLLHISATERREVDQDLLLADLRIEVEDSSNQRLQNKVNTAMAKALELAETYSNVKARTHSYNVHQYNQNGGRKDMPRNMIWKGQQSLKLKSTDAEELLELAGKIQAHGFLMAGLNYALSPEAAAKVQDEMLEAALLKLQNRAQRAAVALGKKTAELKEINTQDNNMPRPPSYQRGAVMAMAGESADMAAPAASPGETTISMTVSAKALLR
ncbi:MAG: putative secreted protein [Alcanivorax sp.]|jgi:predicted secreted protein